MASSLQDLVTPLILASATGQVECVKVLLNSDAQVNLQNKVSAVPNQTMSLADILLYDEGTIKMKYV